MLQVLVKHILTFIGAPADKIGQTSADTYPGQLHTFFIFIGSLMVLVPAAYGYDRSGNSSVQQYELGAGTTGSSTYDRMCPESTRRILGAQTNIDADLALEAVEARRLELPTVKVAVVDSGFDTSTQVLYKRPVSVLKGFDFFPGLFNGSLSPALPDPTQDPDGHGTAVTSLIAAGGGIGINPYASVTVYRLKTEGQGFAETPLTMTLAKACKDGNEIINASIGGILNEGGLATLSERTFFDLSERKNTTLADYFDARGCQLVAAAGNMNIKHYESTRESTDILVGAVTRTNQASLFTPGLVSAVGVKTFVALSEASEYVKNLHSTNSYRCGDVKFGLLPGTSFATPQVTGALSLVRSILKQSRAFTNLPPLEQNKLAKEILLQSRGNLQRVNVLAAVETAYQWTNHPQSALNARNQVKTLNCGAESLTCTTTNNNNCSRQLRRTAALCDGPHQIDALARLALLDLKSNLVEASFAHLNDLKNLDKNHATFAFGSETESTLLKVLASVTMRSQELIEYYRLYKTLFGRSSRTIEAKASAALSQMLKNFDPTDPDDLDSWVELSKLGIVTTTLLEEIEQSTSFDQLALIPIIVEHSPYRFDREIPALQAYLAGGQREVQRQVQELGKDKKYSVAELEHTTRVSEANLVSSVISALSSMRLAANDSEDAFISSLLETYRGTGIVEASVLRARAKQNYRSQDQWIKIILEGPATEFSFVFNALPAIRNSNVSREQEVEWLKALARRWTSPLEAFAIVEVIKTFSDQNLKLTLLESMYWRLEEPLSQPRLSTLMFWGASHIKRGLENLPVSRARDRLLSRIKARFWPYLPRS